MLIRIIIIYILLSAGLYAELKVGDDAPTFEDISSALRELDYVYRGNVRLGCHQGTPMLADVLFVRRDAAERMVEGT